VPIFFITSPSNEAKPREEPKENPSTITEVYLASEQRKGRAVKLLETPFRI
jgi:hypothetical protein